MSERMTEQLIELTVAGIRPLTSHVSAFALRRADGGPLPAWEAGAHIKVQVEAGGVPAWRHYSLVRLDDGAADPHEYLIAVRREDLDAGGRGGSLYLHTKLAQGQTVLASEPVNAFALDARHDKVVLIAGGIGITPLASMAAALRAAGRQYVLHYTGRSLGQLAFAQELQSACGASLALYADDDAERKLDLRAMLSACSPSQPIYTCGPKGMIDAVRAIALELGWSADQVRYELFTEASAEAGDHAFEVELAQSGTTVQVAADTTILDAMLAAGLDPMFDCKRGDCGVCATTVIDGTVDHRDNCLSEAEKAEGKTIHICISRAKGARLVLDA
ncbi:MAG: PDR/VanB family oxidoreductase [Telluria sp.]